MSDNFMRRNSVQAQHAKTAQKPTPAEMLGCTLDMMLQRAGPGVRAISIDPVLMRDVINTLLKLERE